MIELFKFAIGLVILAVLWYFFKTIARFVDNAAHFNNTQKEILERLNQIQSDLDDLKKSTSNDKSHKS
ncbi:MAG: hypothetical protein RLZZ500_931 [Bacteroidota bacterium]|jgi:undecaprenyl pyrophosphate phosphatase UppP